MCKSVYCNYKNISYCFERLLIIVKYTHRTYQKKTRLHDNSNLDNSNLDNSISNNLISSKYIKNYISKSMGKILGKKFV